MSDPAQDQAFQLLLARYLPRGAVRVKEDIRISELPRPRDEFEDEDVAAAMSGLHARA